MPRRPPIQWPNGARIAVIPCVAFETWPNCLSMTTPPVGST